MLQYRSTYVFLLLLLPLTGYSAIASAAFPGDREAGERIRKEILAWLDSFESLQCSYMYRFDTSSGGWKEEEVSFRWQDTMVYYEATTLGWGGVTKAEPIGSLMQESFIDGEVTLLGQQGTNITGEVNRGKLRFSQPTRLLQYVLLKEQLGKKGLHTFLSRPGKATLLERNGERILMYWSTDEELKGDTVSLHLNEMNHITQLDFINRPFCLYEEVEKLTVKDIYELCYWYTRLELLDYQQLDSVWLPCYIREININPTKNSIKHAGSLRRSYDLGEMTRCEYDVKRMENLEYKPNPSTAEIHIDPNTVRINKKMKKADFEIEIPPGTALINMGTGETFETERQTWRERHADLIVIVAMLLLLSTMTVFGWRYWSTNSPAR